MTDCRKSIVSSTSRSPPFSSRGVPRRPPPPKKPSKRSEKSESNHLLIRADYSLLKINIADILLIEGLDDYLKIHLANQKPVVTRMTMKNILEKIPEKNFLRVHRSFIVPLSRIESVRNKVIYIGNQEIPIGGSYEAQFFAAFNS